MHLQLDPGAIKAPQVIAFLGHLRRHLPGPLTIIWDGLPAHRSRLVRDFVVGRRWSGRGWRRARLRRRPRQRDRAEELADDGRALSTLLHANRGLKQARATGDVDRAG